MLYLKNAKGFTLIELMVVVVILGILASLIVPRFMGRTDEARQVKARVDISALETGLKLYKLDNGNYPTTEQGLAALVMEPDTEPLPRKWHKGGAILTGKLCQRIPGEKSICIFRRVFIGILIFFPMGETALPVERGKMQDIKSWEMD